jgi:uncharacterized protein (TIGR02996 family)
VTKESRELYAFLKALQADPTDDETRGLLADWLMDHDEPELAEEHQAFDSEKYKREKEKAEEALREEGRDEIRDEIDNNDEYRCAC